MNRHGHDDWDDEWSGPAPPIPAEPEATLARRIALPPIVTVFACVLLLMAAMVAALNGREWLNHWLHPEAATIRLMPGATDTESAHFTLCHGPRRWNCVIDGDTIHYHGTKVRLTDINAPEISEPQCDYELDLGEKARDRLLQLLNEGRFSLIPPPDRDEDVYGRKLRAITRGGHSLGLVLVAEGLAERWVGFRRDWCH